ncbi:hypothetical protein [Paratissierella segnis]|uniref:Uncharacterized protein n=1 Tax=Paratissierella segnis TaxID=2763679 RepID=A0A926ET68_9FIRM|nr:hypothetical protein [Paratissierella segnis]MBC8588065.1 hypothetical protein [Paratissierella segnis]
MYAILTYSTDQTRPNYQIEFTTSKKKVREALNCEMKPTYGNPELAKNWHNDIKSVYEMPPSWRKPTKSFINKEVERQKGSIYSPNANGVMASCIRRDGVEVKEI